MDSGDALTVDPYFPVPNAVEPVPIKWRSTGSVMPPWIFYLTNDSPLCYTIHICLSECRHTFGWEA